MQTWRKFLFGKSEDCFSSSWWYRGARDSPGKEVKMNQTVPGVADRCIQDPYSSVSKGWIPWYKGGTSCGWYFPLFETVVTSPSQVPLLSWASSAFFSYLHAHIALILVKKVFPALYQMLMKLVGITKVTQEEGHTCSTGQISAVQLEVPQTVQHLLCPVPEEVLHHTSRVPSVLGQNPTERSRFLQILCPRGCRSSSQALQWQLLQAIMQKPLPLLRFIAMQQQVKSKAQTLAYGQRQGWHSHPSFLCNMQNPMSWASLVWPAHQMRFQCGQAEGQNKSRSKGVYFLLTSLIAEVPRSFFLISGAF